MYLNNSRIFGLVLTFVVAGLAASVTATGVRAQTGKLDLHAINFDMWCQEQRHLPPSRCDKRLPQDDAAFRSYVDTIERYETRELNRQARERRLENEFIHYDPVKSSQQPAVAQPGTTPH